MLENKGLSLEESLNQYSRFVYFIDTYIEGKRSSQVKEFFGYRELTLSSSPYSVKSDGIGSYPGGYIETINRLVEASLILEKVWNKFIPEKSYTTEELVFSAIMCEIGKLGTNDDPFFLPNDNDWEIKNRGILYKYNPKFTNLKYSDSALYTLQSNGIKISENEFLGIKLYNSVLEEENSHYNYFSNRPKSYLHLILNQAYTIVNVKK